MHPNKRRFNEKGGVIPSLNQRLYRIKRLKNQVNYDRLRKIAESIWTLRLRYGLQLYGKVRLTGEDVLTKDLEIFFVVVVDVFYSLIQ